MSPYSSNTSSSNPDIQQQYAQQQAEQQQAEQRRAARQQAEQQRAAQNPPVDAPPEQAPRMVQRNRQQQDAVRDEMDIDTGDDDVRAPKRKREEAGEPMEGEDRATKKGRLDPPPEAGPDVRLVARGDVAAVGPLPAKPAVPVTPEALKQAIKSNDLETAKGLLATRQIDLNEEILYGHKSALMVAAKYGRTEMVSLLLDYGADIDTSDSNGETALIYAAENGHAEVISLLIEKGANIHVHNCDGHTVLTFKVIEGNIAMVKQLIKLGAKVNLVDADGKTPLLFAAEKGHAEIFALLLDAGADIHAKDHNGDTVLMYVASWGNVTIMQKLLTPKPDVAVNVNAINKLGITALIFALHEGHVEVASMLIEAGASVHIVDEYGKTVLMGAVILRNVAIVEKLLALGVDVNAGPKNSRTALTLAVICDQIDIVKLLLKHGARVENETLNALTLGDIPTLELLLAYGGEPGETKLTPPPLVSDMLMHRALLKPEVDAAALTLVSLYDTSLSVMPEISANRAVHEELAHIFEGLKICSPITININKQLIDSGRLWQALAGIGSPIRHEQKSMAIAGLLATLEGWVQSWPKDWTPYQGAGLSELGEAKLTALVKLQAEKLAGLGEQAEMKLAGGLETLLLECTQHTQVKNGALVVDETRLTAHLKGKLGLYGPLADQVTLAWTTAVRNQQQMILPAIAPAQQRLLAQRREYELGDMELNWDEMLDLVGPDTWNQDNQVSTLQSVFDEQASESAAGQALLAAFGRALKQIDGVAAGSLLRTSTLEGEQAGLYADLMYRQLYMLMQFADQASVVS